MTAEAVGFALQSGGRFALYLAFFVLTGIAVFRIGVLSKIRDAPAATGQLEKRLAAFALWAGIAAIFVCALRVLAQTYAIFGVDEGFELDFVRIVVMETPWGAGWRFQLLAVIAVAAAAVSIRKSVPLAWYGLLVAVLALGLTLPLTGHAMSQPAGKVIGVGLQFTHIIGASVWIGTLGIVFTLGLNAPAGRDPAPWQAQIVALFSPIALAGVGGLLIGGVLSAFVFLDSWSQLTHTAYGRTLLGKVVFFAATGLVGAYNWRILRPRLGKPGLERSLRWSIGVELVVALIVLGITSVMVALPLEN